MILRYIQSNDDFYNDLLSLLYDIKLTCGNMTLNATLRKHPKIYKALLDKFEKDIDYFESYLDNKSREN